MGEKFSSSLHTLFREDTDMKYLDQFKEILIPRPPAKERLQKKNCGFSDIVKKGRRGQEKGKI